MQNKASGYTKCVGVAYTPLGRGTAPPNCWLKSSMPASLATQQTFIVQSAQLKPLYTGEIWTGTDGISKFYEFQQGDFPYKEWGYGPCCNDATKCTGINVNGVKKQCRNFYDCQDICAYINKQNGGAPLCAGVSFVPGWSTPYCYLNAFQTYSPVYPALQVASARYLIQPGDTSSVVNGTTYQASNGHSLFYDLQNYDLPGDDLQWGACCTDRTKCSGTFNTNWGSFTCNNFYDCQDICSKVNDQTGTRTCYAISYSPNGVGSDPPRCFLKNGVPNLVQQTFVINSAIYYPGT